MLKRLINLLRGQTAPVENCDEAYDRGFAAGYSKAAKHLQAEYEFARVEIVRTAFQDGFVTGVQQTKITRV